MNTLTLSFLAVAAYVLAYRFYGRFLSRRVFAIDSSMEMPAFTSRDGVDFVPSSRNLVLGHHFTTIAGLGPIVGPAIGIIWGWLPAFLWVVFGAIFMGAVHDFSAMVISAHHQGRTIGDLTGDILGSSGRYAFQVLVQFLLWIVVSIFALIMGILFNMYPAAVLPVMAEIPLAVWLGFRIRRGRGDRGASVAAVALLFILIWLGQMLPITVPPLFGSPVITWTLILFVYVFFASTLPIDILLQPRDYLNSHQLLVVMILLALGIIIGHPEVSAPAINPAISTDAIPAMFPLLFITIACGAISGFHSLAASGTTVKQIEKATDMLPIGYGGMLLEGVLATLVIAAVAGGLGLGIEEGGHLYTGAAAFQHHYASWESARGLGPKLAAFITGGANLMQSYGLPTELGRTVLAVFIVSFAGTTLDSATRIQRLALHELCRRDDGRVIRPFHNRYLVTGLVITVAAGLTFAKPGAKGALVLWPLFGAANQLLAGLGLTVATVYLINKRKNFLVTLVPMLFIMAMTIWGMALNFKSFIAKDDILLTCVSLAIFGLTAWIISAAIRAARGNGADRQ